MEQDTQFVMFVGSQPIYSGCSHCCNSRDGWRMTYIPFDCPFPWIQWIILRFPVVNVHAAFWQTQVIPLPCCSSLSTDDRMIKHCTFRFEGLTWQLEQSKSWWREKIEKKMERDKKLLFTPAIIFLMTVDHHHHKQEEIQ